MHTRLSKCWKGTWSVWKPCSREKSRDTLKTISRRLTIS